MKNLYWLAEELQSYTHLLGERFDIDSAYRRLWVMKPHILKIEDLGLKEKVEQHYSNMDEILEQSMFFNKAKFEEQINALMTLLEDELKE